MSDWFHSPVSFISQWLYEGGTFLLVHELTSEKLQERLEEVCRKDVA
jgi:hypothetical protein